MSDTLPARDPVQWLRRRIVGLGTAHAVIEATAGAVAASLSITLAIRWAVDAPMWPMPFVIAAIVPTLITIPIAWLVVRLVIELDRNERALRRLAAQDELTMLYNRRHFFTLAGDELLRQRKHPVQTWLLMLDIDHFKTVNDTFGHLIGDRALQHVATICRDETRPHDLLARFGGEELVLMLLDVDEAGAIAIAERIRRRIAESALLIDGARVVLTISIGLAPLSDTPDSIDPAIARADEALYAAKRCGRDCVCIDRGDGQPARTSERVAQAVAH